MKTTYVFGYQNPDTDGVCSSIAYAHFKRTAIGGEYEPVIFGCVSPETEFVLHHMDVHMPPSVSDLPTEAKIILVDTHHPNQLPTKINFHSVVEILDHHPAGNPGAFPNALIQNEPVGAVATLVAEKILAAHLQPDRHMAGILAAAIISNTLNFVAPSTTDRDREMFRWLQQFNSIEPHFIRQMFDARSVTIAEITDKILQTDYKQFEWGKVKVGISQIELPDASQVLQRSDLIDTLVRLKMTRNIDHMILNVIDLTKSTSTLVTPDLQTQDLVGRALDLLFKDHLAVCSRILLRKSDLIPSLQGILSSHPT